MHILDFRELRGCSFTLSCINHILFLACSMIHVISEYRVSHSEVHVTLCTSRPCHAASKLRNLQPKWNAGNGPLVLNAVGESKCQSKIFPNLAYQHMQKAPNFASCTRSRRTNVASAPWVEMARRQSQSLLTYGLPLLGFIFAGWFGLASIVQSKRELRVRSETEGHARAKVAKPCAPRRRPHKAWMQLKRWTQWSA